MACLDSDILIDFLRKDKIAIGKIKELNETGQKLTTTSINVFELFKGALRSKQDSAIESLNGLFSVLDILDFDFLASQKASEIFENLRIKGEPIDPLDLMIASIAVINNEKLVTRNKKHFNRISELEIDEM
ncbi:type II toxin-antitoxin system VapC family toxin [Candidatus Pacearchaeota archaeon]|nr:type II toxin-antitoxin system VapC family toxin [Candidatus Pacearchaeota archaeon]